MTTVPWEADYWTPEPWWQGQTAFVLASGPSLTPAICDKIAGRKAIVVNASFRLAPWAPVWFFTDSGIYDRYRNEVRAWPHHVITMSRMAKRELNHRIKRVHAENDTAAPITEFPPAGSPYIWAGRSSGHTAVALAIALGAVRIGLVGFDMRIVAGREHHHSEYSGIRDLAQYARDLVPAFNGWRDAARRRGVEIINCTPGSAVTEFPFADLDSVLH